MTGRPDISPPAATSLVERLRAVHLQMLDAVLTGDGLAAVADLAADAAGGPVVVVVPRLGVAVASPGGDAALAATSGSAASCCSTRGVRIRRRSSSCTWPRWPLSPRSRSRRHARRWRRTSAVRSSSRCANGPMGWTRGTSCAAPGGSAATCRTARRCSAPSSRPSARATWSRSSHPSIRGRSPSSWTGASTRCCPAPTRRPP
jgi:hypothetical protein